MCCWEQDCNLAPVLCKILSADGEDWRRNVLRAQRASGSQRPASVPGGLAHVRLQSQFDRSLSASCPHVLSQSFCIISHPLIPCRGSTPAGGLVKQSCRLRRKGGNAGHASRSLRRAGSPHGAAAPFSSACAAPPHGQAQSAKGFHFSQIQALPPASSGISGGGRC